MVDIKVIQDNYFVNMEDVPYALKKGGTLMIKPILTKDYLTYEWALQVLTIDKNEINDIEIIKMSYLEFLQNRIFNTEIGESFKNKLFYIVKLCFGDYLCAIIDNNLVLCDDNKNIKFIITSKEFNDIIKIILHQNNYQYDDRYVNPEVKELMEDLYKIKYKDVVTPSLEKRKAFVSSKTGKTFKELNELPYREFELIYDACKDSEIYIGQKIIQGSYKYQCEDIKHPLFEPKKDMYEELFEDTSVLSNKGISGAEQLVGANLQELTQ